MSETKRPDEGRRAPAITLQRLGELLDAYGAAAERWPAAERRAAERLVAQSAAARALCDEAAALDDLLDRLPSEPVSPVLASRVLAGAPPRRRGRIWRPALVAAVPLAAAAVLAVWLAIEHRPAPRVAVTTLGEYASLTDVLLAPDGVDVYATVPSVGCADSVLGCPKVDAGGGPVSQRSAGRFRA
jgi:hypothetical protein